VLGRLMENGGERFNFMLFSFISTSSLSITIEECHNWLINYEVFESRFSMPWGITR